MSEVDTVQELRDANEGFGGGVEAVEHGFCTSNTVAEYLEDVRHGGYG